MPAPLADIFGYGGVEVPTGSGLTGTNPEMQRLIDQGAIYQTSRDYSNEGGAGNITTNNIDWSKLPPLGPPGVGSKYGNWISAGPNPDDLINPKMVYQDPFYGAVTPSSNSKINLRNGYDMIGPAFAALLTAGVGAPWFLGAGLGAAKAGGGYLSAQEGHEQGNTEVKMPHWAEIFGGEAPASKAAEGGSVAGAMSTSFPTDYNPGLYGNFGSLAAPPDGSAPVMSALVPGAYDNSVNTVTS